jgi:hypothetical protein
MDFLHGSKPLLSQRRGVNGVLPVFSTVKQMLVYRNNLGDVFVGLAY